MAQSTHESGSRGCGSRCSRHVVARCDGLTASFPPDAAAMQSARRAVVLEYAGVVHGCAVAEQAVAACSDPAAVAVVHALVAGHAAYFDSAAVAAERALACSGPAAVAVEHALVAEHPAYFDSVAVELENQKVVVQLPLKSSILLVYSRLYPLQLKPKYYWAVTL